MANLKNIADLPVAESVENLNLIVNENGSAKQIASSAVGAQADFAVTDETSPAFIKNKPAVAQADWSVEDIANPAFIKNRPFYDTREFETVTITFDGDLTGKEVSMEDDYNGWVKLSDEATSKESLIGGTYSGYDYGDSWSTEINASMIFSVDGVTNVDEMFIIVSPEAMDNGAPFTEGIWTYYSTDENGVPQVYTTEISWDSVVSGELKKIDRKYTQSGVFYTMYNGALLYDNGDMVPFSEVKESFANGVVRYKSFTFSQNVGTVIGYCPNIDSGYMSLLCSDPHYGTQTYITPYVIE